MSRRKKIECDARAINAEYASDAERVLPPQKK